MTIYAIVYYAAPNVEVRRFRWISPGAVFGVLLWIVASAVFFVYVSNFSSYSATYGAFAGAVILLIWLWLTNMVLLFGAELNAVIDLRRAPYLPHVRRAGAAGEDRRGLSATTRRRRRPTARRSGACGSPGSGTARRGPGTRRTARGAGSAVTG